MGVTADVQTGKDLEALRLSDSLRDCLAPLFVIVDSEGKVILPPMAGQPMHPFLPEEAGGHPLELLLPVLQSIALEAVQSSQAISEREVTVSAPGGSRKSLRVSAWPIPGSKPVTVLLTIQDCGSLEFLQKPLLQIDRLSHVGMLAASTAHEIKNALVPCKTFLDLLLEEKPGFELAGMVRRELKRMEELLTGVLRISTPGSPIAGPVHLHQVLEDSILLLQPQFTRKSIKIARRFEAPEDLLNGHRNHLQQAFMNLLLNALDAVPEHGVITIRTQAIAQKSGPGTELCVEIQDNGIGIAQENLARLFQPFFTTKSDGTGLGLWIAEQIVSEHGGRIAVESTQDQGSVFKVLLRV